MSTAVEGKPAPGKPAWRLVLALSVVLLLIVGSAVLPRGAKPPPPASPIGERLVTIAVSRPGVETTESTMGWADGMTVRQATELAFPSSWRGEGPMAFLESLEGAPNEGPDGLNWQFDVNGEYATRGAGAVTLEPGDSVLWKLAPYE